MLLLGNVDEQKICWKNSWVTQNPITNQKWNLDETGTQLKCIHLVHKSKPECIIFEADKKGAKVDTFMAKVCDVQRRAGRKFVVMESLNTENSAWKELRRKSGLRQLGVHLPHPLRGLGKALRVTTNSETIIDAILKRDLREELETSVQKG